MKKSPAPFQSLAPVAVLAALAAFPACSGHGATTSAPPPAGDVRVISKGEKVDLKEHLVAGKYTVFDFYADWCVICREVTPRLDSLAEEHDWLAVRKIDVVDWTSEVVKQFDISSLPHMVLYDPQGALVAAGDDILPRIERAVHSGPPGRYASPAGADSDLTPAVGESPAGPS